VLVFSRAGGGDLGQLVWVDRTGKEIAKVGEPDSYRDIALSPDGSRLAYDLEDSRTGTTDVWVRDLNRNVASRLTFDPRNDIWPVWSPDGERIVFTSDRGGRFALRSKAANGTGSDDALYADSNADVGPSDWSADGRRLLLQAYTAAGTWDVQMLPMQGEPKSAEYLHEKTSESRARFSPDGRWVAYASNETGTNEIYVQPYPASGGKWQISNGGGAEALWRADGKELFYRGPDDQIFAVPVTAGANFEPGIPQPLFKRQLVSTGIRRLRWDVARDGQRFILNTVLLAGSTPPFSVVVGWPSTLN
jgi:Tol biopolymer transport system component